MAKQKCASGIDLIAKERQRQIDAEGWTAEHDDGHADAQMALAASGYLVAYRLGGEWKNPPIDWPTEWGKKWWKPSPDPIRNLVKAGALIAAEIDRLQREAGK